jgi:hypothetical protein
MCVAAMAGRVACVRVVLHVVSAGGGKQLRDGRDREYGLASLEVQPNRSLFCGPGPDEVCTSRKLGGRDARVYCSARRSTSGAEPMANIEHVHPC